MINIRNIEPDDVKHIKRVIDNWWGKQYSRDLISKWFFNHFRGTCFVAEENRQMVGFLIGFLSQSRLDEAYVRLVVIHPGYRRKGIGRALYNKYFEVAMFHQRTVIRSVTSPLMKESIKFHASMGFVIEPQKHYYGGIPICNDYDGHGSKRVIMKKLL